MCFFVSHKLDIYKYIYTHYRFQVEDVVSRAADGTSAVQDLDFASLRSQLGPLASVSAQNVNSLFPYSQLLVKVNTQVSFYVIIG